MPTDTPTPLLDLSDIEAPPPAEGGLDLPLYLGGGLAAAIVVGGLAAWGVRRGRQ